MSSAAALLLRPTSATSHALLRTSGRRPNPKSQFLRLHPPRRRLLVPCLSLTPTTASNNNSPPSPPPPDPSPAPSPPPPSQLANWSPPRAIWRGLSALLLAGQVFHRVLTGRVHRRNLLAQLRRVGPESAGVALLTAAFVGMAFTIQFVREFTRLGLHRSVGGVLALALARELSPVVTAVVAAGRVGSAFAAELGTMQVSEQTDTLRVLGAHPVASLARLAVRPTVTLFSKSAEARFCLAQVTLFSVQRGRRASPNRPPPGREVPGSSPALFAQFAHSRRPSFPLALAAPLDGRRSFPRGAGGSVGSSAGGGSA